MIDCSNEKIKSIDEGIHKIINEKNKFNRVNDEIVLENRILDAICNNYDLEPRDCANYLNEKYNYKLKGYDVISVFRNMKISIPSKRKELFEVAEKVTSLFAKVIEGDKKAFEDFDKLKEKLKNESEKQSDRRRNIQERIVLIMLYHCYPELDMYNDIEKIYSLKGVLARLVFYDICDVISNEYGFTVNKNKKEITLEEAIKRICELEQTLERTKNMLEELQNEFNQQIEESKIREMVEFFSKLNSEKYGSILDQLLYMNKQINLLKKNGYKLPIELNGMFIMIKQLIQFVRDNHISPIMKPNSIQKVKASDIEYYVYKGSPFITEEEEKEVRVISPGWIYKDKEIAISTPILKEEKNYDERP